MSNAAKQNQKSVTVESEDFDLAKHFAALPEAARSGLADGLAVAEIGRIARQFREAADLTQSALAEAIGTTQSYISALERGLGTQGPTFALLKRIVEACRYEMTITVRPKKRGKTAPAAVRYEILKS